jgi:hypothetical protein
MKDSECFRKHVFTFDPSSGKGRNWTRGVEFARRVVKPLPFSKWVPPSLIGLAHECKCISRLDISLYWCSGMRSPASRRDMLRQLLSLVESHGMTCMTQNGQGENKIVKKMTIRGGRHLELVVSMDDAIPLGAGKRGLGKVEVDFVAIKVSVEGGAVGVMHADGALALQHSRMVRHHACTHSMLGGRWSGVAAVCRP